MDGEPRNATSEIIRETWPLVSVASLRDGMAFLADDFVREDRRKLLAAPTANAEEYVAGMIEYFSVDPQHVPEFFVDEIVAVRGDRLALALLRMKFGEDRAVQMLVIVQQNASIDGMQKAIRFDPEDLDAAIAELDQLHTQIVAGDA